MQNKPLCTLDHFFALLHQKSWLCAVPLTASYTKVWWLPSLTAAFANSFSLYRKLLSSLLFSISSQPPCLANSFQLLQLFIGLVCLVSKLAHPFFNFVFYHLCASDVFPHLAICQHLDVALQCIHDVRHLGHQASVIGLPDFLHIATCISQQPLTCCLCICHCRLHTLPSKLGSRLGLHDFHSACLGFGAWP